MRRRKPDTIEVQQMKAQAKEEKNHKKMERWEEKGETEAMILIWIVIIPVVIWILSSDSNILILLNDRISDVSTDSFSDSLCMLHYYTNRWQPVNVLFPIISNWIIDSTDWFINSVSF